jgi:hypothetical protein
MLNSKASCPIKATSSFEEQTKNTILQLYYRQTGNGQWYTQDPCFPDPLGDIMPENLKLDFSTDPTVQSKYILTSPRHHGTRRVFTELDPTSFEGWFYGNVPLFANGQIIKCLIIVQVSPDECLFRLYFFKAYYPIGMSVNKLICEKILDILRFRQQAIKTSRTNGKTKPIYDDPGFLDGNLHIDQRPLVAIDTVYKKAHWK